jgi:hypothetical protein
VGQGGDAPNVMDKTNSKLTTDVTSVAEISIG